MTSDTRLGNYEIVRRLGVGGMAEAFLAVRKGPAGFEQRVCLKRVLPAFAEDADFVDMFVREATFAASLRHGNIVGIIELGSEEGVHFMALELVDGVDLRNLLKSCAGHTLPTPLVALVAADMLHALEYAHTRTHRGKPQGIVHRDISPANVLISYAGEVKLADFGVAKAMHNSAATATMGLKGKIPYMSPEQAGGKPVDGRSDLFSLGVVLYEAVAGRRPFDGRSQMDTMRRIMDGDRDSLAAAAPDAPAGLVAVIESLIACDPADRPASAANALDALGGVTPPPSARRQLGTLARTARPPRTLAPGDLFAPGGTAGGSDGEPFADTERSPGAARVVSSAPDAETRTRTPDDAADHQGEGEPLSGKTPSTAPATPRASRPSGMPAADDAAGAGGRSAALWVRLSLGGALAAALVGGAGAWIAAEPASVPEPPTVGGPVAADAAEPSAGAGSETPGKAARDRGQRPSAGTAATPAVAAPATPATATHARAAPGARPPQPTAAEPSRQPATDPAGGAETPGPGPEPAARPSSTRLRIAVVPWGNVWIDGRARGRAPVTVRVSPGRHTVAVGTESPTQTQRVTVEPGQRRRLVIDREPQ